MKDTAALKPSIFSTLPSLMEEKASIDGSSPEELALHQLSLSEGWRVFKSFTEELLKDLELGTETAMAQGLPFEEIGRNAVVINLAKGIINRQLQKVQDAVEAIEQTNGTKK